MHEMDGACSENREMIKATKSQPQNFKRKEPLNDLVVDGRKLLKII
jgi:hypothetical protein